MPVHGGWSSAEVEARGKLKQSAAKATFVAPAPTGDFFFVGHMMGPWALPHIHSHSGSDNQDYFI